MVWVPWRIIGASVQGTSHLENGSPCQDSNRIKTINRDDGEQILVCAVSDGAGSAVHSDFGAELACDHFVSCVSNHLSSGAGIASLSGALVKSWVDEYQDTLRFIAESAGCAVADFASTLLVAVLGDRFSAFAQIGDGAMVVVPNGEPDDLRWVFWPQQREYENVTHFVSSPDAALNLQFRIYPEPVDEIALFTDGLQRLVLHYPTRKVHAPFFQKKLRVLRREAPGISVDMTDSLIRYLESEAINARTDDDKTLVLATRCRADEFDEFEKVGQDGGRNKVSPDQ